MKKLIALLSMQLLSLYERTGLERQLRPLAEKYEAMGVDQQKMMKTGLALALVSLHALFLLSPTIQSFMDLVQKTHKLESEVNLAVLDINGQTHSEKILKRSEMELQNTHARLVTENEIPEFLDDLSKIAQKANVHIEALKPLKMKEITMGKKGKPAPNPHNLPKGYKPTGFEIRMHAKTHDLGQFLALLENNEVFVQVKTAEIYHEPLDKERQHDVFMKIFLLKRPSE